MRFLLSLSVLVSATLCLDLEQHQNFHSFKAKFSKVYKSAAEERLRHSIFMRNVAEAEAHNNAGSSYTKGINEWSDLTHTEWEDIYIGGYKHIATYSQPIQERTKAIKDLPESKDWRDEGVITDVKNQGQCGSCWAFGTTEQIEAYTALAGNELVELSAQQVSILSWCPFSFHLHLDRSPLVHPTP